MEHTFTLDEARQVLAEIREPLDEVVEIRAELASRAHAHNSGQAQSIPDLKALEARMGELLDSVRARGVEVKGYAPLLLDFPMEHEERTILLCWLEGEDQLTWFHETELGFMGRRRLDDLS